MRKTKLLALLLVVAMIASMIVPSVAATNTGACPEHTDVTTWTDVAEGAWTGGTLESGHYKLTGNQTLTSALTVAGDVCIDLNGCNITAPDAVRAFEITGALTICDNAEVDGTISGGNWSVNPSADEYYYGGNILVSGEGSKLNIYGGTLIGREMKAGSYRGHVYGGNIAAMDGAELNIYGGLITAGSLIINQQATKYHGGGNIYAATATVNISGGVISDGKVTAKYSSGSKDNRKAYGVGGNIDVVSTTLNITGGLIDNGSVDVSCKSTCTTAAPTATSEGHGGNVYALSSTVSITGGTISNGTLSSAATTANGGTATNESFGGNIYLQNTPTTIGGTAQIIDGEILNDVTSARGGNIYMESSEVVIEGNAVISGGLCPTDNARGGNIFTASALTINGGTIANGAAGWGANMMLQSGGSITLNGGKVLGGTGSYSVLVQRGTFTMNGGSIENAGESGSLSVQGTTESNGGKAYINAGTVGKIFANRLSVVEIAVGVTYGDIATAHTPTITIAGEASVKVGDKYTAYATLADASYALMACQTIILNKDVTAAEFQVAATITLDLNGKTLTVDTFTSAFDGAQVIDSVGTGKLVVAGTATFDADNAQLPIKTEDGYVFETVAFAENLSVDTTATYKFYIKNEAAQTLIDDAILNGQAASIDVKVTWTNGVGESKEKTFTLDANLLEQYVGAWDTKMIILTINDLTNVTDLTCTAQITLNGVTVTA